MGTLSTAVDELYSADPDEFVARRTALVTAARAEKDRDLVRALQAFRKPTRSAWMVNLLARRRGTELTQLLDLRETLSQAHTGGSMTALRETSALRRKVLDALIRVARELAREAGHEPTAATLTEVHTILDAALTHPEITDAVRAGVLTRAPESAAAFPTELFAPLAEVVPLPQQTQPGEPQDRDRNGTDTQAPDAQAAADERKARRAEQLRAAEDAVELANARQAAARDFQQEAGAERAHIVSTLAELEDRLVAARADLDATDLRMAAIEDEVQLAARAVADAEQELRRIATLAP